MLNVKNLTIRIQNNNKDDFYVLREASFYLNPGETLGILGESGSGKSILAKAICGLNKPPVTVTDGSITFMGKKLESEKDFSDIHRGGISMIFQHPTSALNPVFKIGDQLIETILQHNIVENKKAAKDYAISLLADTGIEHPSDRMNAYPHQLSGGMNQRVMIALALSTSPKILIADEPTTALDVITQCQIIKLIKELSAAKGFSTIFITHDFALMQNVADNIVVLYAGEVMEKISSGDLRTGRIKHPCTKALKDCLPTLDMKVGKRLPTIKGQIAKNTEKYDNCCIFYERCKYVQKKCSEVKPLFHKDLKCFYPCSD